MITLGVRSFASLRMTDITSQDNRQKIIFGSLSGLYGEENAFTVVRM